MRKIAKSSLPAGPLQTGQTLCAVTVQAFFIPRSGLVLTYLTNMLIMMDR